MTQEMDWIRREMRIEGMSCQHCVMAVRRALDAVGGVRVESVDVGRAVVFYDPSRVGELRLRAAIEAEGYRVES